MIFTPRINVRMICYHLKVNVILNYILVIFLSSIFQYFIKHLRPLYLPSVKYLPLIILLVLTFLILSHLFFFRYGIHSIIFSTLLHSLHEKMSKICLKNTPKNAEFFFHFFQSQIWFNGELSKMWKPTLVKADTAKRIL